MKKHIPFLLIVSLAACSSADPILPGARTAIFASAEITVQNTAVPDANVAGDFTNGAVKNDYTQDAQNIIWSGNKKIFSGFPTAARVNVERFPQVAGGFIYTGLTTGEVVKVNAKSRELAWATDLFAATNITGGSGILDIPAPVVVRGSAVYAGGLGGQFCKLNAGTGAKTWCVSIAVGMPFMVGEKTIYALATDNNLYAINSADGKIYWRAAASKQSAPEIKNNIITVARDKFDMLTGKNI